jgi:hypothetical protein
MELRMKWIKEVVLREIITSTLTYTIGSKRVSKGSISLGYRKLEVKVLRASRNRAVRGRKPQWRVLWRIKRVKMALEKVTNPTTVLLESTIRFRIWVESFLMTIRNKPLNWQVSKLQSARKGLWMPLTPTANSKSNLTCRVSTSLIKVRPLRLYTNPLNHRETSKIYMLVPSIHPMQVKVIHR